MQGKTILSILAGGHRSESTFSFSRRSTRWLVTGARSGSRYTTPQLHLLPDLTTVQVRIPQHSAAHVC